MTPNPFATDSRERAQHRMVVQIARELESAAKGGSLLRSSLDTADAVAPLGRPFLQSPAELMRRDMEQKRIFEAWQRDMDEWQHELELWDEPPTRLSLDARLRKEIEREG